jgi:hypothetical protein
MSAKHTRGEERAQHEQAAGRHDGQHDQPDRALALERLA